LEHRLRELFTKGILGQTEAANNRTQAVGPAALREAGELTRHKPER
jgi:hypothetical protein